MRESLHASSLTLPTLYSRLLHVGSFLFLARNSVEADQLLDVAGKCLDIAFDLREHMNKMAVDDETKQLAEDAYMSFHRLYVRLYRKINNPVNETMSSLPDAGPRTMPHLSIINGNGLRHFRSHVMNNHGRFMNKASRFVRLMHLAATSMTRAKEAATGGDVPRSHVLLKRAMRLSDAALKRVPRDYDALVAPTKAGMDVWR